MNANNPKLSEGSLQIIMRGGNYDNPIMQVLSSKTIATPKNEMQRYRILLSDGINLISFAMVNAEVSSGTLESNSIIRIKKHATHFIEKGDKRVLIIMDMDILVPGNLTHKIGHPEPLALDDAVASASSSSSYNFNGPTTSALQNNSGANCNGNAAENISLQASMTHPISSLSPYQNRWVIKARVTNKSAVRTWSNSRGEGKLFSVDLVDESGEIKLTAFRDLVDRFYDLLEVDKVYYITKCVLKPANKQFNTLKSDYEMNITGETIIQECLDSVDSIPQTKYDFIPIDKIAHIDVGTSIDIIGVCKSASDLQLIHARSTGRELKKREVTLVDQSNAAVALTLWGADAEGFDGSSHPVVVVKRAKIGEFGGGKNVSVSMQSIMKVNPDIPESYRLKGWFDNGGNQTEPVNISARSGTGGLQTNWMSIKEAQEANLGHSDRGDYYKVNAMILLYRSENGIYKACPTEECNKKIIDLENGMYRCEKCNREFPNFKYRLLGYMNVGDWSGNSWVSVFANEAEKILGMTSQQVGEAIEANKDALAKIADKVNFKSYTLTCRAKVENFNDESRLKTVVVKVEPVNYKDYNSYMISKIRELTN